MKPSAPKSIVWTIALILGILGIIGHYVTVPIATEYNYMFLLIGFVLLAIGTSFKGV